MQWNVNTWHPDWQYYIIYTHDCIKRNILYFVYIKSPADACHKSFVRRTVLIFRVLPFKSLLTNHIWHLLRQLFTGRRARDPEEEEEEDVRLSCLLRWPVKDENIQIQNCNFPTKNHEEWLFFCWVSKWHWPLDFLEPRPANGVSSSKYLLDP